MNTLQARVMAEIHQLGPLGAFHKLIEENNQAIARPSLDNGRRVVEERTAVFTGMVTHWAQTKNREVGGDNKFAVVATGGTGRGEITPRSDTDFAILLEQRIQDNALAELLQRDLLNHGEGGFHHRYGFEFHCPTFSMEDAANLDDESLNGMLDMRAVYDPHGLATTFRERIRATYDPFKHFIHVRKIWKDKWEQEAWESERLEGFHVKDDALRVFLAGVWSLAGKSFVSCQEIYGSELDRRDLEAYEFLLRVRTYVHWRRSQNRGWMKTENGVKDPDLMSFDDFLSFGELLGPGATELARQDFAERARWRLLCSRRRLSRFAKGVIQRELKAGRPVKKQADIVLGPGGLFHSKAGRDWNARDRSSAALGLLRASQRYGVPIDPGELQATFHNAGDWMMRVPELSALFYEDQGSLADSLEFLSQVEAAEDRLFPGYKRFEVSIDERVAKQRTSLRGVFEREKLRTLDGFVRQGRERLKQRTSAPAEVDPNPQGGVWEEAAQLDPDQLAAVKLALKIKRLPVTPEDLDAVLQGSGQPAPKTSGFSDVPLEEYCDRLESECGFTRDTIKLTKMLVANRRLLMALAQDGPNDDEKVEKVVERFKDESSLRALYVFTCADRSHWESPKDRGDVWELIRELYNKSMLSFHPELEPKDALRRAGFDPEQELILSDFGPALYKGNYLRYTLRFGGHLAELAEHPDSTPPKASILREGEVTILAVAARDYPGLAATMTGVLWRAGISLRRAHFFSATRYGLAFDFFQLSPEDPNVNAALAKEMERAILTRKYIADEDEEALSATEGEAKLGVWRTGKFNLQFASEKDRAGLVYVLTYKIHKYLRGNIFALQADTTSSGRVFVSVYFEAPPEFSMEKISELVAENIGKRHV